MLGKGKSVASFGVIEIASELIYDLISPGGVVTLPGISNKTAPGGYDA
jgi:hypothetical protein